MPLLSLFSHINVNCIGIKFDTEILTKSMISSYNHFVMLGFNSFHRLGFSSHSAFSSVRVRCKVAYKRPYFYSLSKIMCLIIRLCIYIYLFK